MLKLSNVLLSPKKAEHRPIEIIVVGFLYATLSIFLSLWMFPDYASLVMVFLTVISCVYVVQGALILEETKEEEVNSEKTLIKEHVRVLMLFLCLFLGFTFAFTFWQIALPDDTVKLVFNIQESVVSGIRTITGNAISSASFYPILTNNLRVLMVSLVFAMIYGGGAIFILAWNASTIGFAMGNAVRETLGLKYLPAVVLKYFLHGIPEMIAYFIVAMVGGIMFITIVREDVRKTRLKRVIIDSTLMIALAIVILVLAALIEVYLSPLI